MEDVLNHKLSHALANPIETVLWPAFHEKAHIKSLIKQLALLKSDKSHQFLLLLQKEIANKSDLETLKIIGQHIITLSQDEDTYKDLANYYGMDFPVINPSDPQIIKLEKIAAREKVQELVYQHGLRPLKQAFNHIGESYIASEKLNPNLIPRITNNQAPIIDMSFKFHVDRFYLSTHSSKLPAQIAKRKYYKFSDKFSNTLSLLVAIGQAGIAASCFTAAGVALPWFIPIFLASFITNYLLLKPDIQSLMRNLIAAVKFDKDFLQGLSGTRRFLAYCSLIFAIASGLSFGFMALGCGYSAFMAIIPAIGMGAIALPWLGWTIATIIAIATIPVMTALMFRAMADFIKDWDEIRNKIKNYFSLQGFTELSNKQKIVFILSRALTPLLALAAITITFFAVVATFGSYTSSITATLNKITGIAIKTAHAAALVVVFACNLIPEFIFNFRNIMIFFSIVPTHLATLWNRATLICHSDIHYAAKIRSLATVLLTLGILGLVALNGYGNGSTGADPSGDGIKFLKMLGLSSKFAAVIALVTSTSISVAANETYAMDQLNHHTPIANSYLKTQDELLKVKPSESAMATQTALSLDPDLTSPVRSNSIPRPFWRDKDPIQNLTNDSDSLILSSQ